MAKITLIPLTAEDREKFIRDNQEAFNYGALEEFGRRDDHFEEDGEIISRETIEKSIDGGEAYRIMCDDEKVGEKPASYPVLANLNFASDEKGICNSLLCHIQPFRSRGNLAGGRADGFVRLPWYDSPTAPNGAV